MHWLDRLQIHTILLGLWLVEWPLLLISVDNLKHFSKWLFHSPILCQPLCALPIARTRRSQQIFLTFFSSALQRCSFQLTSPSFISGRTKCSHCFQRPAFLYVFWTSLHPAFPILLYVYPTFSSMFGLCHVFQLCSVTANIFRSLFVSKRNQLFPHNLVSKSR